MSHDISPTKRLTELQKAVAAEQVLLETVQASDAYIAIVREQEQLEQKRLALLADVPDSREEFQAAKRDLIALMQSQNIEKIDNVSAKFKETKEVNKGRVLEVIGGDLDIFVGMANITQVALKDFAKISPTLKTELLDCIEVTAKQIVDLEIA